MPQDRSSGPAALARYAVEHFVTATNFPPEPSEGFPEWLRGPARGVFVCIKQKGDRLRGCIGSIEPASASLAAEILMSAVAAASRDPRFPPVALDELPSLSYTVDVLSAPESIEEVEELNPQVYGVIVSHGSRKGLLLPRIDEVATVRDQVDIARRKARIGAWEDYSLHRFKVDRYSEASGVAPAEGGPS